MIASMMGIAWYWIVAIVLVAALVFRAGFALGRAARDADMVPPIDPGRISPAARPAIDAAIRNRELIAAIKLVREDTGCSLAAAKKTVEGMMH